MFQLVNTIRNENHISSENENFDHHDRYCVCIGSSAFGTFSGGGIIIHHLLSRNDMPGISNWWGVLIVPLLTWIFLTLIQMKHRKSDRMQGSVSKQEIRRFIGEFIFGIVITILFYQAPELPGHLLLLTFVLVLFLPIYRLEYYLGYILSMTYGFGGVLPVVFGLGLITIYWIECRFLGKALLFTISKIK